MVDLGIRDPSDDSPRKVECSPLATRMPIARSESTWVGQGGMKVLTTATAGTMSNVTGSSFSFGSPSG